MTGNSNRNFYLACTFAIAFLGFSILGAKDEGWGKTAEKILPVLTLFINVNP